MHKVNTPYIPTLPPYDPCVRHDELLPAHAFLMTYEVILCKGFSKHIRYLVLVIHRKNFDQVFSEVFVKVMIAYVNVLSAWVES